MWSNLARAAVASAGLVGATVVGNGPARANEMMTVAEAKEFVHGKLFTYQCFEGTTGAGRVYPDGSVVGSIQIRGEGPVRYVALPPGTIRVKGESVCAYLRGLPFEPCFNLQKTSPRSFRGSVWGFGFAFCDFTRRSARVDLASTPLRLTPIQPGGADARKPLQTEKQTAQQD
jgi:hypothetical protein